MCNTIKRSVLMTSYEKNESNLEKESNNNKNKKGNVSKVPTPGLFSVPSFWFCFVCNY